MAHDPASTEAPTQDRPAQVPGQMDPPADTQPAGSASPGVVESAPLNTVVPDAMGNDPTQPAPPSDSGATVKVIDGQEALSTTSTDVGPHGTALPAVGEVAGGNIVKTLAPPPPADSITRPMVKEQAAMRTKIGQQIAGLIARPITEWGVIGPGDTVRGHMLLLDLNTGEKVRAMDGHRVNAGELYMNLRNVPEALATGDTIARVLEGG